MFVRPLEVIWIYDATITPPGNKMVAAIHPERGWFYRINTKPRRPCVKLIKTPDHEFLDHDSHLECGDPLEIDDYLIEEGLRNRGVIGRIAVSHCETIKRFVATARTLTTADKQAICEILDGCEGI